MKPATSANPDTVYDMLDNYLVGMGALASLVYSNVKTNTKRGDSSIRYSFVKEGDTVGNCAKSLLASYVEGGEPEKGVGEIQKICGDIGWDTWPPHSFYTLVCPPNCGKADEE